MRTRTSCKWSKKKSVVRNENFCDREVPRRYWETQCNFSYHQAYENDRTWEIEVNSVFAEATTWKVWSSLGVALEILEWCSAHSDISTDDDIPFVLKHHVSAESSNVEEQDLKIVISTRRLLNFLTYSDCLQADPTYKVMWQGYPLLIMGCSDKNDTFHPFCLAVCKERRIYRRLCFRVWRCPATQCWTTAFNFIGGFKRCDNSWFEERFWYSQSPSPLFLSRSEESRKVSQGSDKRRYSGLQTCISQVTFIEASELFITKWDGKVRVSRNL